MATKEYFPGIGKIKFEGKESKNPMAFRYYDAEKVINGKKMKDWLKFAMAWWHTLCAEGGDQFGGGTKKFPWNGDADKVQFKATVKDGQLTVSETPRFIEVKFSSGHAPTNGNYILQNNDYEQFAGVALKDFYVTLQVKRMDQGESTSGIYYYTEGASSPVKILLLRADDDTVKIRLTRGTGWDDRSDRDYVTAIPWQEELALSVVSLGDTLHVGVNGTWTAISRSTSYKEVVHNVDFDEATVWNADAVKTFGIFANGASDTGFPVTGIAYSSGVQQPLAYLEKRRRP